MIVFVVKKADEANKNIYEVYGVGCITERTCQNLFKKFRIKISIIIYIDLEQMHEYTQNFDKINHELFTYY